MSKREDNSELKRIGRYVGHEVKSIPDVFRLRWRRTGRYVAAFLAGPILFTTLVVLAITHTVYLRDAFGNVKYVRDIETVIGPLRTVQLSIPVPSWLAPDVSWLHPLLLWAPLFFYVLFGLICAVTFFAYFRARVVKSSPHEFIDQGRPKRWFQKIGSPLWWAHAVSTWFVVLLGVTVVGLITLAVVQEVAAIVFAWSMFLFISLLIWLLVIAPWASPKRRDMDRFWSQAAFVFTILNLLSLVVIIGVVPKTSFLALLSCWLTTLGVLILLTLYIGYIRHDRLLGIFIDRRNRVSLAQFQLLVWTILIASTFLAQVLGNVAAAPLSYTPNCPATGRCNFTVAWLTNESLVKEHYMTALSVTIPTEVLILAGISASALVATPFVTIPKKGASGAEVCESLLSWMNRQFVPRQASFTPKQHKERKDGGQPPSREDVTTLIRCDALDCAQYRTGGKRATQPFPQTVNCSVDIAVFKQKAKSVYNEGLSMCGPRTLETPVTTQDEYDAMKLLRSVAKRTVEFRLQCMREDLCRKPARTPEELKAVGAIADDWATLVTRFALKSYTLSDLWDFQKRCLRGLTEPTKPHKAGSEEKMFCQYDTCKSDLKQGCEDKMLDRCIAKLERSCERVSRATSMSIREWIDAFNRIRFILDEPAYVDDLDRFGDVLQTYLQARIDDNYTSPDALKAVNQLKQKLTTVDTLRQKLDERRSDYRSKKRPGSTLEEDDAAQLLAILEGTEKHVSRLVPEGPIRSNVRRDLVQLIGALRTKRTLDSIMTEGLFVSRRRAGDARFSDMFMGDDIDSWQQIDFSKVQMFCFTLILSLAYGVTVTAMFLSVLPQYTAFPAMQPAIAWFLGISNGGYIIYKAAPRDLGKEKEPSTLGDDFQQTVDKIANIEEQLKKLMK